jgi:hypothetical protein
MPVRDYRTMTFPYRISFSEYRAKYYIALPIGYNSENL